MLKRSVKVLAMVFAVSCLAFLTYVYTANQRALRLHEDALKHVSKDSFYKQFLIVYFGMFKAPDFPEVCINEKFKSDCLNIVVMREPADTAFRVGHNMRAVGKNLLVIDKSLLDMLMIASNYATKSEVAKYLFRGRGFSPFATEVIWGQQYTAIERDRRAGGKIYANEVERVKAGIVGMAAMDKSKLPPEIREQWSEAKLGLIAGATGAAGLAMMIEHELGHLRIHPLKRVWLRVRSTITRGPSRATQLEEDLVDAAAIKRLPEIMSTLLQHFPAMPGTDIERAALYANFLFFWNDGLFEFFDTLLLPIKAEDFLYEVMFDECFIDKSFLDAIPDPVLAMIPKLRQARLRPMPLLSKEEFERLGNVLRSSASHSHSAIRALGLFRQILDHIKGNSVAPVDPEGFGIDPDVFEGARSGADVSGKALISAVSKSLSTSMLHSAVGRAGATMEKGYLCPATNCEVVRAGLTQLESIANGNDIVQVRLTFSNIDRHFNLLASEIIKELDTALKLKKGTLLNISRSVSRRCPGSFKLVESKMGEAVVVIHKATPDLAYVELRYLRLP